MKRMIALLLAFCLLPCAVLCGEAEAAKEKEPVTMYDVRYYFEHVMLRDYFFQGCGILISYLRRNGPGLMLEDLAYKNGCVSDYDESEFGVREFTREDGTEVLLLLMPKPEKTPLCARIYMCSNPESGAAGYFTVEYDDFLGEGWCLCEWKDSKTHIYHGMIDALPDQDAPEYENALEAEMDKVLALMPSE